MLRLPRTFRSVVALTLIASLGLAGAAGSPAHAEGLADDIDTDDIDSGYWLLDDVGGVITKGDVEYHGSIPGLREAGNDIPITPVTGLAPTNTHDGYFILDEKGGVFALGEAEFEGSIPGLRAAGATIPEVP
ncbi:MAG: hypothetical protein HYU28_12660, partial [Actinobacteria bacterium]|nr:hypothetical protein [Actinomycetota bacterium]